MLDNLKIVIFKDDRKKYVWLFHTKVNSTKNSESNYKNSFNLKTHNKYKMMRYNNDKNV